MEPKENTLSRRRFLAGILAASATPPLLPRLVRGGQNAPGRIVRLGHIGTGGQGTALLRNFLTVEGAVSAAICDPYRERRERAADYVKEAQGHDPKLYNDFRELLADPAIDAVVIATPDHWHVPVGLAAVRAGKDVYIEKPLGHTLAQNRAMLEACRKTGRIFQYGTQQRSQEMLKRGVELVLNGAIGDLRRLDVWAPGGQGGGSLEEIPVPEGLDYDLYIGPAPMKPCTKDRITTSGSWYCSDYALGFIAGWGAHPLDIAVWGTDADTKGPVRFRGTGEFPTPHALFDTCATWDVEITLAGGIPMHFMSTEKAKPIVEKYRGDFQGDGTTFFGSRGWISLSREGAAASNPEWLKQRTSPGPKRVVYYNRYYKAFADSVRDRRPSISPIEDAVRSDSLSHLSLLAIKSGGEVVWDPKGYKIISPESLNAQMSQPVRGGWAQS
jgi:predicted dehydrogenase